MRILGYAGSDMRGLDAAFGVGRGKRGLEGWVGCEMEMKSRGRRGVVVKVRHGNYKERVELEGGGCR